MDRAIIMVCERRDGHAEKKKIKKFKKLLTAQKMYGIISEQMKQNALRSHLAAPRAGLIR